MTGSPHKVTRRQLLRLAGVSGLGLTGLGYLAGCGGAEDATSTTAATASGSKDDLPPVRIGYIPITDATPLLIAHAQGYFAEEGLEAEQPALIRSWSALAEAFQAGTFNLTHLLIPIPIYLRYARGFPVKVVAWNHMNNSALTVRDDGPIRSSADLGGRQIAVPYWYSMHNVILQMVLRSHGLQPVIQDQKAALAADQTNLLVMSPPDMPTALSTGAIDGYIVAEPFNAAGELLAGGRIVRFTGDVWQNHPCCVAVMHGDDVTARRAWSQKAVNALVRAERWSRENKEEAARILSKDGAGYLPFPENVIARAMIKYDLETYGVDGGTGAIRHPEWRSSRIAFEPYQFRSATKRIVQELKQTVLEGDTSFLKDLSPEHVADDLMVYGLVKTSLGQWGGLAAFDGAYKDYERTEVIEV
ncbi:MAG: ABC transporter substrate-binding protein [Thermoleophilia bacterium]|nr:ABC transporter substrate-binding protein [Thermoleophilia bacterium]